jgi:DNA-nicking Smr family endonuclease
MNCKQNDGIISTYYYLPGCIQRKKVQEILSLNSILGYNVYELPYFLFPDVAMKQGKSAVTSKSFQDLKSLFKAKSVSLPRHRPSMPVQETELGPEMEEKLFQEAMEGVAPISRENCVERVLVFRPAEYGRAEEVRNQEDAEALFLLNRLVKEGMGFRVADTPEYIEGTSYDMSAKVAERLHEGTYSIQAHLDLHGLNTHDARKVLENFFKSAVVTGKKGVLIILTSPAEPVLKTLVVEWLTRGPWRKWVAAYASARLHDGGTGATYVLLRSRPITKSAKRK